MRTIYILFVLFGFSNAVVEFTNSVIFDEYDITGVQKISINKCKNGCNIWASMTYKYRDYAANVDVVVDNESKGNIKDIAQKYEPNTEKSSLQIDGGADIFIRNNNTATDKCGPIIIYVAAKSAPNNGLYQIYDASNTNTVKVNSPVTSIITFLSLQPFYVLVSEGKYNAATARLVGFDNALDNNVDKCTYAYSSDSKGSFKLQVNGPIVSVVFGTATNTVMQVLLHFDIDQPIYYHGYFSSPGFVGCYGGKGLDQVYRSSEYKDNDNVHFSMASTNKANFTIETELNTDADHPLIITDITNDKIVTQSGKPPAKNQFNLQIDLASNVEVDMVRDDKSSGFILRYSAVLAETVTTTTPPSTTTGTGSTTTKTSSYGTVLLGAILSMMTLAYNCI